jgi:rSAM/selenodomain-associated transferase 2
MTWQLSLIIPVLNEATGIVPALQALQALRTECQLIVVDGGSQDDTVALAMPWVDCVLKSARGRAVQMNHGAATAHAPILVFLHSDTHLPKEAVPYIQRALAKNYQWGRCDVAFDSPKFIFKIIATMMNFRSYVTGIATGDQAMFMTRAAYEAVDGFPVLALMEL